MDAHAVDALFVSDFINYVLNIQQWVKAEKEQAAARAAGMSQ